jgi:hypothetical protein
LVNLELQYGAQSKTNAVLQAAVASHAATISQQSDDLARAESARAEIVVKLASFETECARLGAELAAGKSAIADAQALAGAEATRVAKLLVAAELRESELEAQVTRLRTEGEAQIQELRLQRQRDLDGLESEHAKRIAQMQTENSAQVTEFESAAQASEQEMNVLMAHLLEARRPLEPIQAEVKRLTEELTLKTAQMEELAGEHHKIRAALERTRGALEEREFLIRRLERSESNNANVLGRIQTSIERLGAAGPGATGAPGTEMSAELVRVDGERSATHMLARRTRIGRASGCELQIDSSSVSRHHALIILGPREAVIEDLNSTNGVMLNGHKVSRHLLNDGDAVTIGDVQFRFVVKTAARAPDVVTAEPPRVG